MVSWFLKGGYALAQGLFGSSGFFGSAKYTKQTRQTRWFPRSTGAENAARP
jgi:hypothetical protein